MTIVVTGASGFIGAHLVRALRQRDVHVRAIVRSAAKASSMRAGVEPVIVDDIGAPVKWEPILEGADAVVHLAGRAHVLRAGAADEMDLYRRTNVVGTRQLAEAAARTGVKKFVFVSSSKAMGDQTRPDEARREDDACDPQEPYGRTKLEAEHVLRAIAAESGLVAIILRPPVVYGPGVGANILELFRLVDRGVPLPLATVRNRRSFVYVDNLVDTILLTLDCQSPATYCVSDGEDVSTGELARRIGAALGRPARLVPVPPALLRAAARVGDACERRLRTALPITTPNVARLTQSFVIDATRIRTELGWRPRYDLDAGLRETARWYTESRLRPRTLREPTLKRPFDLCAAAIGLLAFAPLSALIAALIWLEDGRPIFFRQPRIGRYGRMFRVLKFRSMYRDPARVEVQARRNDPRITRVGRMLRRTGMDELPQLWNIVRGEMSFVGPRAQPEKERVKVRGVEQDVYIREVPGYELRQLVRPGLTGITQLFAHRDVPHRYKFKYDVLYVKKVIASAARPSLAADLKMFAYDLSLILRTIWITLGARWEI